MPTTTRTDLGGLTTYRAVPADPKAYFSEDEVEKSKRYQRPLSRARIVGLIANLVWLLAYIHFDVAGRLTDQLGIDAWPLEVLVISVSLVVIGILVSLPISAWTNFVHEERWGFNTTTPSTFIADNIKGLVLGSVITGALLLALWGLIRITDLWWLFGALVITAFSVVLAALYPVLILPIFNKLGPIEDEELSQHLTSLAHEGGVNVSEVQEMDASKRTRHDNAFFAGLGKTRKLVIFDNMADWDRELLDVVVAHEVGHWRHGHLIRSVLWGTLTSFMVFVGLKFLMQWEAALDWAGVSTVRDPDAIGLFLLGFSVLGTITGLIDSWLSRAHERQADLFALDLTRDPTSFQQVWREFTEKDLPDLDPSLLKRLRGSHPPIAQRLRFGDVWAEQNPQPQKADT